MTDIDFLKNQLENLTAVAAFDTLIQHFGRGNQTFLFNSTQHTVGDAHKDFQACELTMRCSDFGYINFFGGPPHKGRWLRGTLLTMLCDAVLFEKHSKHLDPHAKQYA